MSSIKERIMGAITMMDDTEAEAVWNFVIENLSPRSWDNIEEVTPDELDLKMLKDIETDPDCQEFIPQEELIQELGISL